MSDHPRMRTGAPEKKSWRSTWWKWALGSSLLASLLWTAGPQAIFEAALGVSPGWAAVTLLVAAAWLTLGALNVWLLLRCLSTVSFPHFVRAYITAWAVSNVVPGQLGDATQLWLLRRRGVTLAASGAAYVVDKLVSLAWMSLVAAIGLGLYSASARGWWLIALPVATLLAAGTLLALGSRLRGRPGSLIDQGRQLAVNLLSHLNTFRRFPGRVALNSALTVLKWLVVAAKYLSAFLAFGVRLDFQAAATIPVVSSLVGYIPITVGGIGTTEWTAVALFRRAGASATTVVSVYLFLRLALLFIALVLLLFLQHDKLSPCRPPATSHREIT